MHELTLCEAILDALDAQKRQHGFSAVRRLRLEIGRFACIDPDALIYAFEVTTRGGWLDGTEVEVLRPPGHARCLDCEADVEIAERFDLCPRCGGARLRVERGDQMRLVDMEVA